MLSWLAPLLVLGLVIFVHELGHFLAAKWAGVYAPRFSLGWGKPVWSFRRGETEYALSALPIGGYVRMASKEDETASALEGGGEDAGAEPERSKHWDEHSMIPHGPHPIPADRWFESQAALQARLVIMLAGVFMNVVLAIVVSTGIFAYYGRGYLPAVVDSVVVGKPAALSGMQRGDSITAVDGRPSRAGTKSCEVVSAAPGSRDHHRPSCAGDRPMDARVTPEAQEVPCPPPVRCSAWGGSASAPRATPQRGGRSPSARPWSEGWNATWGMAGSVINVLGGLFRGSVSVSAARRAGGDRPDQRRGGAVGAGSRTSGR
jgi:regulator of sigma E protease